MKKKTALIFSILFIVVPIALPLGAQGKPAPNPAAPPKPAPAATPAPAAAAKKKTDKDKKEEVKEPVVEAPKETSWKSRYVPAIGILAAGGPALSGINEYVGPGLGGELFGSLDIGHWFFPSTKPFRLRAVLSASGYYYSNKAGAVPATLMIFPVIGSLQFSYFITKDARFIVRGGAGGTYDMLKINDATAAKTTDSSLSFAYQGDLGVGYNFSNGIEILLFAGYMGQMQTLSASYLNGRLGIAYYF